jgi:hypothetical protein
MQELTKEERRRIKRMRKRERREQEQKERLSTGRRKNLIIYSSIGIVLILAVYLFVWQDQLPGTYDEFAQCLTEKGFIMAGTDWCSNCKIQKGLFGKSFEFIDYNNCDIEKQWCDQKGVDRYPTWILPDGSFRSGTQELQTLSQLSGCDL